MNKHLTITFLSIIFFWAMPCAHGMEPDLPENTQICILAALSVYGDEYPESKEATTALAKLGYTTQEIYKHPAVGLRMDLWEGPNKTPIIAYRGTIPIIENLLSDAAIMKYGLDVPNPSAYITEFVRNTATTWYKDHLITDPTEELINTIHTVETAVSELASGGIKTFFWSAFGAIVLTKVYEAITSYDPEAKAINSLVQTVQAALKKTNEWMERLKQPPLIAAHSLGGLVANAVFEVSDNIPQDVLIANAPCVTEKFINDKKKEILGTQDNTPHTFRCITRNICRANEVVNCFGLEDASRKSTTLPDYRDPKGPMSIRDYPLANHSIYNLARDLGAL